MSPSRSSTFAPAAHSRWCSRVETVLLPAPDKPVNHTVHPAATMDRGARKSVLSVSTLHTSCRFGDGFCACALRGAETFAGEVCQKLGVKLNETTKDGEWTVEAVMCLAACDHAPMFQVQDATGIHYHQSETIDKPMSADDALAILKSYPASGKSS